MAAVASLLITGCNKDDDYSSIVGTWIGYSRSHTIIKNGQPVSPETFVRDLIKAGLIEEPADATEMAEMIEEAQESIYDTKKEFAFEQDLFDSAYVDDPLRAMGYSVRNRVVFRKI